MSLPNQPSDITPPSAILVRLLDPSKKWDYFYAFLVGALPIGVSLLVGADDTATISSELIYEGFLDQSNWWSLAFLIPIALFTFRWMMDKIVPVHMPWPPANLPPIIRLVTHEQSQAVVYGNLRNKVLDRQNLFISLAVVTVVTALDIWPVISPYVNSAALSHAELSHHDWRSMFIINASDSCAPECIVSKTGNSILVAIAYLAQFVITSIGILIIVLILRHNLFFLGNVYQRRRTTHTPANQLFQIDIQDVNRCFGFRRAYGAFNTQVLALILGGLATLLSRYAHTVDSQDNNVASFVWPPAIPQLSFPVAGQWAMAVVWLAALFIVALPGIVKLLPRIPSRQTDSIQASITHYLREFFPDGQWPTTEHGHEESTPMVAARFANNSFWPTGDNRARSLFFFSYWIFFVILQPPALNNTATLLVSLGVFALAAYLATLGTFKILNLLLGYVDQTLIATANMQNVPSMSSSTSETPEKMDVGIFISYRRKDTIEYARSIHKELQKHFLDTRLFRDLSAIAPGENFVTAVNESLTEVDNIIVLIGVDWTSIVDSRGQLRLHNPEDMVRLEVATALGSGKRVIPVLLEGAPMPSASELPEILQPLCLLNALEITDSRWEYDVGRLVNTLKS